MQPVAIMFDFDGTVFDTMGKYAALGSEVMATHFGVSKRKAWKIFFANAGIPFPQLLKKIFSKSPDSKIKSCAKEYDERKPKEVYGLARPYRDVEPALRALKSKGFSLFVSSSTESAIIEPLLKKYGLKKYFSGVFGLNQGIKENHIETVLSQKGFEKVCFVGDSKVDAALGKRFASGTVFTIGRAGGKRQGLHKKRTLLKSGATFVTSDLRSVATIDFEKAMQKSLKGKRYRRTPKRVFQQFKMRLKRR
jgi:phosphoglycolate phosphatase-like HAD superfamily hydrolase